MGKLPQLKDLSQLQPHVESEGVNNGVPSPEQANPTPVTEEVLDAGPKMGEHGPWRTFQPAKYRLAPRNGQPANIRVDH